jgi:hypothetical protein
MHKILSVFMFNWYNSEDLNPVQKWNTLITYILLINLSGNLGKLTK